MGERLTSGRACHKNDLAIGGLVVILACSSME